MNAMLSLLEIAADLGEWTAHPALNLMLSRHSFVKQYIGALLINETCTIIKSKESQIFIQVVISKAVDREECGLGTTKH